MWDWMSEYRPSCYLADLWLPWVFGPHVGGLSDKAHLNESTRALFGLLGAAAVTTKDSFLDLAASGVSLIEPRVGRDLLVVGVQVPAAGEVEHALLVLVKYLYQSLLVACPEVIGWFSR